MASQTRWTWDWVNSRRWWWTGRPDVLRFMGSQRAGHDWVTELNWTELNWTELNLLIGFPGGADSKKSSFSAGYLGSIPVFGRSFGEGNGYPLQYSAWRIPWTVRTTCFLLRKLLYFLVPPLPLQISPSELSERLFSRLKYSVLSAK